MSEVLHCAGCKGTDYLGRECRGRTCPPPRAASQERPLIDVDYNAAIDALAEICADDDAACVCSGCVVLRRLGGAS